MLLASAAVIVGTAGGSVALVVGTVLRAALRLPCHAEARTIVVAGCAPSGRGGISRDFALRLDRARTLWRPSRTIMVLGGVTRPGSPSEARLGRDYLIGHGVPPARIALEEHSRHTLENLINLRRLLAGGDHFPAVLVTSRFHGARCRAMSEGLGLPLTVLAAEPSLPWRWRTIRLVVLEGLLLHWYYVGRWLSARLAYRQALARIT